MYRIYRIMGYFRFAKFSRFCLKNMAIIFLRILIFMVGNVRENCKVGGTTTFP